MWRFLYTILFVMMLSGCSITIDPQTVNQNDTSSEDNQQQSTQQPEQQHSEETIEETESEGLMDLLSDVFNIDWTSGKDTDAQDIYYLALGDSLTRGVGDEQKNYGYTIRLQEQIEQWPMIKSVELDNRGKNGRRSDQLLALLQKGHYDEELEKADVITMTLGGNDAMKIVKKHLFSLNKQMFNEELPQFITRYEEILHEIRLRNADVPIVVIGFYNPFSIIVDEVTPFEPIISEWNAEIESLANIDVNACFVPIDDLFTSNEDMVYHVDFFHPNATGYDRMTKRIIEAMQSCNIEQMSDGLIGIEEWEDE